MSGVGSKGSGMIEGREQNTAGEDRQRASEKAMACGCGGPTRTDVPDVSRCVQMEKMTDTGSKSSESFGGGWAGLTLSAAGLAEDIFLKNHLLLHGGECVVVIL